MESFRFIDLFCGIGGFRIALSGLGHRCVFSSDIDKEARKVYRDNFGEIPEGDITSIPSSAIPPHDVICAGFPCQPFSISGKQKGFLDTRGTLFHEIARIAAHHQPKIVFLENVANLFEHDEGKTLQTIINRMGELNYSVYYAVLNASYYGVPQSRKRIYFICLRKDIEVKYDFPAPTFEQVSLKNILLNDSEVKNLILKRSDVVLRKAYVEPDIFGKYPLQPIRVGFVNKGGQGERIYHELGHAITLSAYGGGVGAKTGLYLINGNVRKLHPEECKKAMSFPDDFILSSNPNQAYKQFGNSVAVKVIKVIFQKLQEDLDCKPKAMQKSEMKLREASYAC